MIAMLLAVQISAAALPQGVALEVIPPPRGYITPANGILRGQPAKNCPGAGRMETSFAKPTALYRSSDRPAKGLRRWADYPEPRLCAVEVTP